MLYRLSAKSSVMFKIPTILLGYRLKAESLRRQGMNTVKAVTPGVERTNFCRLIFRPDSILQNKNRKGGLSC